MSQVAHEVDSKSATAVASAPLGLLGTYQVPFSFSNSSTTTRQVTVSLQNVPEGTKLAVIAVQAFEADYTNNEQYGFGAFAVSMTLNGLTSATCSMTLRDNNINKRSWEGYATGIVTFYGV